MYLNLELAKDYTKISPQTIDPNEAILLADQILTSIFPSFTKEIEKYNNLIYVYQDLPFSNSCLKYSVNQTGKPVFDEIQIPEKFTEYTVGCVNHEKMHVLMLKNIDLTDFPILYFELFSILVEKISSYIIDQQLTDSNALLISNIMHTIDNQYHIKNLNHLRKVNLDEQSLKKTVVYQFLNQRANYYLIFDWYSDLLLNYYLSDKDSFNKKLNELFTNQITIFEYLAYYNISLNNDRIYPNIKEKLEKVKKYSIIP